MWQLGLRYDHADLNDGSFTAPSTVTGVLGGEESNWTVGVNWYWRSNFKLALNYVKVSSERYSSSKKLFVQDDPSIVEAARPALLVSAWLNDPAACCNQTVMLGDKSYPGRARLPCPAILQGV